MRERLQWDKAFIQDMQKGWPPQASLSVYQSCQVELGLFFLRQLHPDLPAPALWRVLAGYPLPGGCPAKMRPLVSIARYHLVFFQSPREWEQALEQYMKLPAQVRAYQIATPDGTVLEQTPELRPDRLGVYAAMLNTPPPYVPNLLEMAGKGRFRCQVEQPFEVVFKDLPPFSPPPQHNLTSPPSPRPPLTVTWEELVETARWMDTQSRQRHLPEQNWEQRIKRTQLQVPGPNGRWESTETLTVERLYHMCGMVSAGKSTFMDVLAVHLARTGRRSTVVVGDVMAVLERVHRYQSLGIHAIPVLGSRDRERHLERFYRVCSAAGPAALMQQHYGERYLSTACALLTVSTEPELTPRDYPCANLIPVGNQEEGKTGRKRMLCPLYCGCPTHRAQQEAPDAPIWVTTPAGLLYVEAGQAFTPARIRWGELAARTQDLIIIDEADRVQSYLDLAFSTTVPLVSNQEASLLKFINEKILSARDLNLHRALSHEEVDHWIQVYETIRTIVWRLRALLLREPELHAWLIQQECFTDWSLFHCIACDLNPAPDQMPRRAEMMKHITDFLDDPFGEDKTETVSDLVALAHGTVNQTGDSGRRKLRRDIGKWLDSWQTPDPAHATQTEENRQNLIVRTELAIIVTVLQNRLHWLLRYWPIIEARLQTGEPPPFQSVPDDYLGIIPAAPMGNTLTFQYLAPEKDGELGTLRFLRYVGVGRWLLLNLPELLVGEQAAGAHTLLLSGTSWAGKSSSFHIQTAVNGILRPHESDVTEIGRSHFEFLPLYDSNQQPIRVSGLPPGKREEALAKMCQALVSRHQNHPARLEIIRQQLPARRQKVLLLTGSYSETKFVAECIRALRPDWAPQIRHLVPDREGEEVSWEKNERKALPRGRVADFGPGSEWLLVAPLAAIERGHNILNEDHEAAIGAACFLVRPHPPPNDLSFVILSINRWAMEEIQKAETQTLTPDWSPTTFRQRAYRRWRFLLRRPIRYQTLLRSDREDLIWTQLVLIWQTIGRLVRGGKQAWVYFLDAAFAPRTARGEKGQDTPKTSLLLGMRDVLAPYFTPSDVPPEQRVPIIALYQPLYDALCHIPGLPNTLPGATSKNATVP